MTPSASSSTPQAAAGPIAAALRSHGWVVLTAALATIAIELGVYALARTCGVSESLAVVGALATAVVCVALGAAALASGPRGHLGGVIRGVTVADASAVTLLVLWLVAPDSVTFGGAVRVYCTLAAVALAAVAVVRCGRTAFGRGVMAVAASTVLMAMLTTPLWLGGLMKATSGPTHRAVIVTGVYANPFYSITTAVSEQTRFVWHLSGVMYDLTRIGSFSPAPEPPWYAATLIYLCIAAVALGACVLITRIAKPDSP